MSELLEKVKNIVKIEKAEITVPGQQVSLYSLPSVSWPVTFGDLKARLSLQSDYQSPGHNYVELRGPGKFRIWLIVEKVEEEKELGKE